MPGTRTVLDWLVDDKHLDFRAKYTRAREAWQELEVERLTELADEEPPTLPNGGVDNGWVTWQRNRIATRQWTAAKLVPKKYGDKVAVGGAEDLPAIKTEAVEPQEVARRVAFLLRKGSE